MRRIVRAPMRRRAVTTPRKAPRQERSQATVEAILAATARVLVRDGFEHASTNRIAAVAGVSVGSLYQYFPNKQALVRALYDRLLADAERVRPEALRDDDGAPRASLDDVIAAAARWHLAMRAREPRLHAELAAHASEIVGPGSLRAYDRMHDALVGARLERHRDEIGVRDLDLAAFLVSTVLEAVAHAAATRRPELLDDDALAHELTRLLLLYLRAPDASAAALDGRGVVGRDVRAPRTSSAPRRKHGGAASAGARRPRRANVRA